MATAIMATYINGSFMPDDEVILEEGARVSLTYTISENMLNKLDSANDAFWGSNALLDEATRVFNGAFAASYRDKDKIKRGATLAWEAAWMNAKRVAQERGWKCDAPDDASAIMMRLGGVDEADPTDGDFGLFRRFCAAEGFYELAYGKPSDPIRYLPREDWQMLDGVESIRELARMLYEIDEREEVRT